MYMEATLEAAQAYGIVPSQDLMRMSREATVESERAIRRSSLRDLTYETAIQDAHEALVGLAADLTGATERRSLGAMLAHGDRLRGLGILLVALAVVGMAAEYIMEA